MSEQWGPWIEHDGTAMPVPGRVFVQVKFRAPPGSDEFNPWEGGAYAEFLAWYHDGKNDDIIRYRVKKPRGLTILQRIAANPQHERIEA